MSTPARRSDPTTVITTEGLKLASGTEVPDLEIHSGFTMLHCRRESSATTLAMTMAGRMHPKKGKVTVTGNHRVHSKMHEIHKRIAFAGVPEVTEVERLITVHTAIRERAVWAGSWWKITPHNIENIAAYTEAAKLLDFHFDNATAKKTLVGDLDPFDRAKLQVVLALISRPHPVALLVDDIDALRSLVLRRNFLQLLSQVATAFPVVVLTSNAADRQYSHEYIQVDVQGQNVLTMQQEAPGHLLPSAEKKALQPGSTKAQELQPQSQPQIAEVLPPASSEEPAPGKRRKQPDSYPFPTSSGFTYPTDSTNLTDTPRAVPRDLDQQP